MRARPTEPRIHWIEPRYWVLVMLCVCAAIAYIQRAAISVPAEEIAERLQMKDLAREMGWIHSIWYFCYGIMQVPSGWLADRFGSRRMLSLFVILWSMATLSSSLASGFYSLLILWGMMGATQAGAFPCAAKAIGLIFPDEQRARATGALAAGMTIGGALAPVVTGLLLQSVAPLAETLTVDRWRLVMATYAIPGFVWAVLFLIIIPSSFLPHPKQVNREQSSNFSWRILLSEPTVILLCAQQFFRAAGMVFFMTWFPTFLQKTRGVTITQSGVLATIAGAGGAIGSLTGGFFSDWLLRRTGNARLSRQGIAVAGMSCCAALIVGSYFVNHVHTSIVMISLGAFCATFGGVSGYTVAISFGGRYVATVFSTMNMCGNMGAALFPLLAGWLVSYTGNWELILFLFAAIMAIDAFCWALLNPRGTIDDKFH